MARSKSPAPQRTRAAKTTPVAPAKKFAISELGDELQVGIAVAVIAAVYYCASGGSLSLSGFGEQLSSGFDLDTPAMLDSIFHKSFNFVLVLHAVNSIAMSKVTGAYWLNKFAQDFIACFAGLILPKIMSGGNMYDAIFADPGQNFAISCFFSLWYVINYDIPGCPVNFGFWGKLVDFGGASLEIVLDFASSTFTTNLIVAAVSEQTPFSPDWFKAIAMGTIAGTAASFFPFNKGFKFAVSDEHNHAFAVSCFIANGGFKIIDFFMDFVLDFAGQESLLIGAKLNQYVCGPFGGVAGFVVTITALNMLFGPTIADAAKIPLKSGFDVFGLLNFCLSKVQLE